MVKFLKDNIRLFLLLSSWVVVGVLLNQAAYLWVPVSAFLLTRRSSLFEFIIGFWTILILSDSLHYALSFAIFTKILYILLLMGYFLMNRRNFGDLQGIVTVFIPFLIIAMFCLFKSENVLTSFQKTLSYVFLLICIPNYFVDIFKKDRDRLLKGVIFFGVVILIIGVAMIVINPSLAYHQDRFRGIFGNPNGLGIFCLLFFLFIQVVLEFWPQIFTKREKQLVIGTVLFSLFLSGSRGAIASLAIFYTFKILYRYSAALGFFVFLILLVSYEAISSNIDVIVINLGLEDYFRIETLQQGSGRRVAWDFAWTQIEESPWLGKGFSHTEFIFKKNAPMLNDLGHQGHAHNSFLTLWIDTGIFGLVSHLIALVVLMVRAAKNSKLAFPILYAILFSNMVESWLSASLNPFTIIFFMVLTLITSKEILASRIENVNT